jgi:hypothetical protein
MAQKSLKGPYCGDFWRDRDILKNYAFFPRDISVIFPLEINGQMCGSTRIMPSSHMSSIQTGAAALPSDAPTAAAAPVV